MSASISLLIPLLNEGKQIPSLIEHLTPFIVQGCEVIFIDGDSDDNTVEQLLAHQQTVLVSKRGRALQMNAGAEHASGNILLFLHADTRLPNSALADIQQAIHTGKHWGRFDVRIDGDKRRLRVVAMMMNLRSRLSGIATGDQAIFIRRDVFFSLGGFPNQPLMEDIEISKQLKAYGHPACLSSKVVTSGRRWLQHGIWKTIFLMWRLRLAYWLGTPADQLAKRYL